MVLSIEKFLSLVKLRKAMMLQHLIQFCSIIYPVVTYEGLKTKENFRLIALKVVMVAYERWLLTRGAKYSDLTWKGLVFWETGCQGEVVIGDQRFNCIDNQTQGLVLLNNTTFDIVQEQVI